MGSGPLSAALLGIDVPDLGRLERRMERDETDMIPEHILWEALGAIRRALEQTLPPGAVRSANEVQTVQEEVEALTAAIRGAGSSPTGA
jgi:hypothetical protein